MDFDLEAAAQMFLAESREGLETMEEALVLLETRPGDDEETLPTIFRVAHTLKGNAASLGFGELAGFAHVLEDLLDRLRRRELPVTSALVSLLLAAVDALRQIVPDAVGGVDELSPSHQALRKRLGDAAAEGARETGAEAPPVDHSLPTPRDGNPDARARTLRVDVEKLDYLLTLTGEIAIARGRVRQMLEGLKAAEAIPVLAAHREADRLYTDLQELVMKARMVPVGPAFRAYIRTVRDTAEAHGKKARLVIEGHDVEVDTAVIEQIRDPLTHMIRNALDHGIEPPATRAAAGKDPCGTVVLRARHEAGSIVIEVEDDGAGLSRERILRRAGVMGLAADPESLSDSEVFSFVFAAGFSTAEAVTEMSGRGVGMDVVRRNIEALRGSVAIDSRPGQRTAFTIRLPLTLAIIEGFGVGVGDETYVIPLDVVTECLELPREQDGGRGRSGVLSLRGEALPYVRLREAFGLEGLASAREHVVVVRNGQGRAGIVVDALHGEGETVIKPLGPLFKDVPGVAGSSVVGDGRVALILDTSVILREFTRSGPPNQLQGVES